MAFLKKFKFSDEITEITEVTEYLTIHTTL